MRKILETGVPGWLGSRFVELISSEKKSYRREDYAIKCLVHPHAELGNRSFRHIETARGDFTDSDSLKGLMNGYDAVVHIAGVIHPSRVKEYYTINVQGTRNVLDEACRAGIRRFVYISSNSPMGFNIPPDSIFTEESRYCPYMNYGKSKYLAELSVKDAHSSGKIETVILRACWFYGPRQPARQSKFFSMIKSGNPIIFGDGSARRSMSYVDNTVQGIVLALEVNDAAGETYWIADERPYEVIEIYRTVAKLLGVKDFKPRKLPAFTSLMCEWADYFIQSMGFYVQEIHVASEMARSIACSIEKAKQELGYRPEIDLLEGMRRSIDWCLSHGQTF